MPDEENRYLIEYYKNEYDANKNMVYANAFAALMVLIIFILYATKVFPLSGNIFLIALIVLPINIIILASPLFYLRTEYIKRPGFKYFVVFSFLLAVGLLNIVVPKHAAIAWALPIVIANHYYNPKLGRVVFFLTLFGLLFCLYAGMFIGEYDPHLLGSGYIKDGVLVQPDTPKERFDMIMARIENGQDNRFISVLVYYFTSRGILVTLVFFISQTLNQRTYKLLVNEIHVNTQQQKISTELEVAKEIQLQTLPNELISDKDIRMIGELKAAKEIGGDFYDYFDLEDNHIGIVIGDVSGKGIPAAMFMMKTITCFKNFATKDQKPSEILRKVNAAIYDRNESNMFVTCFFGILNKKTGEFNFANAGHNPPVIGSHKSYHLLKCNPGFVLGGFKECFSVDESITLQKGESITLYTDGITEARNKRGELYGETRLLNYLNSKDFYSVLEMHHGIKDDVAKFVKDAEQSDDMTMLTLMFHGDEFESIEKEFDAKIDNMKDMLDVINDFCEKQSIPDEFKRNLLVVGDEIFSNIIKHGYKGEEGTIFIRLMYNINKKEFVFTIIDRAPAFNQLDVNNMPIVGDAEKQHIGGLGIMIVKKIMTECAYDRINKKNILVLRKSFE